MAGSRQATGDIQPLIAKPAPFKLSQSTLNGRAADLQLVGCCPRRAIQVLAVHQGVVVDSAAWRPPRTQLHIGLAQALPDRANSDVVARRKLLQ